MSKYIEVFITDLYDRYDNQPIIKGLIQALSFYGIPLGPIIDSAIGTFANKIKSNRLCKFFDELNSGDVILSEEKIESNDFLHAYFSTVDYVIRTKSDYKIECFARILKNLSAGNIDIDEFEDYTSIFNELSEREFYILSNKYKYEQNHKDIVTEMNPAQVTKSYWNDFLKTSCSQLDISKEELDSMLVRIQRTGCYRKYTEYWEDTYNQRGETTKLFKILYDLIITEKTKKNNIDLS